MIEHKRSAAVLVFNAQGELALQLRAAHDNSFPSHWDFSAGGGIDEGEESKASAERELREELGVEAKVTFVTEGHCTYPAWTQGNTREVDLYLYKTTYDGPFKPDPEEVERVEFFTLQTIESMVRKGERFHTEFVLAWKKGWIVK